MCLGGLCCVLQCPIDFFSNTVWSWRIRLPQWIVFSGLWCILCWLLPNSELCNRSHFCDVYGSSILFTYQICRTQHVFTVIRFILIDFNYAIILNSNSQIEIDFQAKYCQNGSAPLIISQLLLSNSSDASIAVWLASQTN